MKIAFFAESCLPFHGNTLLERPLGGTETGVIHLAAELSKLGNEVYVFTHANGFPDNQSVHYANVGQIFKFHPFDILVIVKNWKAIV
jgi:hypothetical protein